MQVKPLSSVLCQVHQMYMKLQILVLLRHVAQHDRHVCVCVRVQTAKRRHIQQKKAWQHSSDEGVCRAADQDDLR